MTVADIAGEIVEEFVLLPRGYRTRELSRGDVLRVTDLEGRQVGDLIAFNRADLREKFWISNTIRLNGYRPTA